MGIAQFWEQSPSAHVDEKGVRTYTRNIRVQMASFTDVPPVTWATLPIARYSPYPYDAGALAVALNCTPVSDQLGFFDIAIDYTSAPFDQGDTSGDPENTDQSTSPPSRPWVLKFGSAHTKRLLGPKDLAGKAVVNSAGQPFDPPPEVPCSNLLIQITAFKPYTYNVGAQKLLFQDSVNNAAWTLPVSPVLNAVFPQYSLRCNEYDDQSHNENGEAYWEINVTLEYQVKPWHPLQVLDAGTVYRKSMALPPQPILDATGNPIEHPIPLNGSGQPLLAGADLVYIDLQAYNLVDYSLLLA